MLQLGPIDVDPPLILAPMAGVTDRDFRLMVRRIGGVGLVTMEFISAKGLVGGDRRVLDLMHYAEEERPISIPLTVKFRLGLDDRRRNFLELGWICEDGGVCAVALHARTAKQHYTGEAEWPAIAELKRALSIPVIGNGDVRAPADAVRLLRETGCDGVMIGRGATHHPWVFRQIAAELSSGEVEQPGWEQRRDLILEHFRTVIEREERKMAMFKLQTFTGLYSKGLPGGLALRRQIHGLRHPESFLEAIERFFEDLIPRAA